MINAKTAKTLGLKLPDNVLALADEVNRMTVTLLRLLTITLDFHASDKYGGIKPP